MRDQLISAYDHIKDQSHDRIKQRKLREASLSGVDIVDEVVRLCGMNLHLHGIGNGEGLIRPGDVSLKGSPLTNYQSLAKQLDYGTLCRSSGCVTPHYIDARFMFRTINRELFPRLRRRCRARQDRRSALTEFFLLLQK